ncbi:lamin tail domain-containing protein [Deinococcus sp.]|uniref:lamin tail domain-containing protein n=1 Tax=Deinococcus sp. TaxID=47478 RepID=UPI0025BE8F92|nr:lamin tail domain-containing protein [Deinococcus sp.]
MVSRRFSLLALMGTLLLGACGQQAVTGTQAQPVVAAPVGQVAAHGLYNLHISPVSGRVQANVSGDHLSAQELGGLSFSAAAAATTTDATSKHYAVAITVTNNSGKDISQPLYVPVAVSGYTQNNTYFSNAQNSSGGPTDPTGVTLEQATGGTPLVSTNVSSSLISAPGPATVSPQAWQAPTLPSGGTQTVTFGFSIPLSNVTNSFNVVFSVFATPKVDHLVISQVYGGGGNTSAQYRNDFIEIFNPTNGDVELSSYTVEGFSATGLTKGTQALSGSLKPGGYFLLAANSNSTTGSALPTPDATNLQLALSSTDASVTLSNASGVVDTLGYGAVKTNKFEGTLLKALSNTTAALRNSSGCTDSNNNSTDFTVAAPAPRNSASAANLCQ